MVEAGETRVVYCDERQPNHAGGDSGVKAVNSGCFFFVFGRRFMEPQASEWTNMGPHNQRPKGIFGGVSNDDSGARKFWGLVRSWSSLGREIWTSGRDKKFLVLGGGDDSFSSLPFCRLKYLRCQQSNQAKLNKKRRVIRPRNIKYPYDLLKQYSFVPGGKESFTVYVSEGGISNIHA